MKLVQIIEENADIRENTSELLELNGYAIAPSVNGKSGVEIFRNTKPDLVICDLHRAESNGKKFIEQLQTDSAFSETPIIFLTGEDGLPDWFPYKLENYFGYLQKPFTAEELLEAVSMSLKKGNHNMVQF